MKKLFILFLLLALLSSCASPAVSNTLPQSTEQASSTQAKDTEEPTTSEKLSADDIIVPDIFYENTSPNSGEIFNEKYYISQSIKSLSNYESSCNDGLGKGLLWLPFDESWGEFSSFLYESVAIADLYQRFYVDISSLNLGVTKLKIEFVNKFTSPELYYNNVQDLNNNIKKYNKKGDFSGNDFRFADAGADYLTKLGSNYLYQNEGILYYYKAIASKDPESKLELNYIDFVDGDYYLKISFLDAFNEASLPEGEFISKLLTPAYSKNTLMDIAKDQSVYKVDNSATAEEDPYSKFKVGTTAHFFHEEALQKLLLEEDSLIGFVDYDPRWGELKYSMIDYTNGYQLFQIDYYWGEYCFEVYSKELAPKVYEWEKNQIEKLKTNFSGDGSDIIHSANKKLDENGWYYSSGLAYHYTDGLLDQLKFTTDEHFIHFTRLPGCFYTEDTNYQQYREEYPDYSSFYYSNVGLILSAYRKLPYYSWIYDHGWFTKLEDSFIADFLDSEKALQKANDFIK